jgi:hypothetical protein
MHVLLSSRSTGDRRCRWIFIREVGSEPTGRLACRNTDISGPRLRAWGAAPLFFLLLIRSKQLRTEHRWQANINLRVGQASPDISIRAARMTSLNFRSLASKKTRFYPMPPARAALTLRAVRRTGMSHPETVTNRRQMTKTQWRVLHTCYSSVPEP